MLLYIKYAVMLLCIKLYNELTIELFVNYIQKVCCTKSLSGYVAFKEHIAVREPTDAQQIIQAQNSLSCYLVKNFRIHLLEYLNYPVFRLLLQKRVESLP